jgi:hypothetical protein
MIIDALTRVSNAQAVTAAAASTDYIDLGAARDIGQSEGLDLMINVNTSAASATSIGKVAFQIQCDDNASFSSPKTVSQTDALGVAALTAGKQFFLPIPPGLDERYVRVYYAVSGENLTAGAFTAAIVKGRQANKHYPDAI